MVGRFSCVFALAGLSSARNFPARFVKIGHRPGVIESFLQHGGDARAVRADPRGGEVPVRHIAAGPFEGLDKNDLPTQLCPFTAAVLRT